MNKNFFLLIFIPILFLMLYYGNIKPIRASRAGVRGEIEKSLNYNTFINYEVRMKLALEAVKGTDLDFIKLAKKEMEINVSERPLDVKSYMVLIFLCYISGDKTRTLELTEKALELAPNRPDLQEFYKAIKQEEAP